MKTSLRAATALVFGLLSAAACSSDKTPVVGGSQISGDCLVNSDCAERLVCAFQRCHAECVTTRDCDGILRCVGAHEATRVCQLEVEAKCKTSADCASGFVCSSDGTCRDHCQSDAECIGSQVCTKGVCAEPAELDAAGQLPQVIALRNCRLNSDCEAGERCALGSCVAQCVNDRDCAPGEACAEGACRKLLASECASSNDCGRAGSTCFEGKCRCECLKDVDCADGRTCDGCACQAAPAPECVKADDCADGKQCVDGACLCRCVEDRDCAAGLLCDGCSCVAPAVPTTIHDAIVRDATDVAQLKGIQTVESTLLLTGPDLLNTVGLESLQSVGRLEMTDLASFMTYQDGPNPFAGLGNLTHIAGNLLIKNVQVTTLQLSPNLVIDGDVQINSTSLTCKTLATLQQSLVMNGFKGSFQTMWNGGCSGACVQGNCVFIP